MPLLEAALKLASLGWPVFLLHGITEGGKCTCGKDPCKSAGKHPLSFGKIVNGYKDATTNIEVVKSWCAEFPWANLGVPTGGGFVIMDIDPRHGGDKSLIELENMHGKLPTTVEQRTGGGGRHLAFAHPGGKIPNAVKMGGYNGIDVRGDGGHICVDPSLHESLNNYTWVNPPWAMKLAPLPAWLLKMMRSPVMTKKGDTGTGDKKYTQVVYKNGDRNASLASLGGLVRLAVATRGEIYDVLWPFNLKRCAPPLTEDEVWSIAVSVSKYTVATTWPDPLQDEAFIGLAGEFVHTVSPHSEADPAALLIQFLTAFGNVIGRGPHFVADGNIHYTNLATMVVGKTSRSRKGSSWGHVRNVVQKVDDTWRKQVKAGLSSGEGLIYAVRDPVEKFKPVKKKRSTGNEPDEYNAIVETMGDNTEYKKSLVDAGVSDKRLLVYEAEFAAALKVMVRDGNTLSTMIRLAFDGDDLSTLTKNSPLYATAPHISFVGHITRDELRRYLSTTEMGNGLANRFLWVCVQRSKLLPHGGTLRDEDWQPIVARLRDAITHADTIERMSFDDAASTTWNRVYAALTKDQPGLFGAITARSEVHVRRVACIYAVLDRSPKVCLVHLEAALAVWRYCEASVRCIFGDLIGDNVADKILAALREKPEGMTRSDVHGAFGRNQPIDAIETAFKQLLDLGYAYFVVEQTKGRSVERWFAGAPKTSDTEQEGSTNGATKETTEALPK